jgi:hypothetical protein
LNAFNKFIKDSSNCKTLALDPSNNLFGNTFCSSDLTNYAAGPNKYLAFSHSNRYVIAQGFLYDNSGNKILCNDDNYSIPRLHDIVVSGLFSTANINFSYQTTSTYKDIKDTISFSYFTGAGYVFRICCGEGPNNEKGWWKFFIRPLIGFFQPQKQIPIELIIPNKDVDESFIYLNNIVSKNSISGKTILQGGIYNTGSIPSATNRNPRDVFNYGGGLAFVNYEKFITALFKQTMDIKSMMGWKGNWSNAENPSGNFEKSPLFIENGAGDPCVRNLLRGNNSQQNYLVAYHPTKEKIKFNINPVLYDIQENSTTNLSLYKKGKAGISGIKNNFYLSNNTDIFYINFPIFDVDDPYKYKSILNDGAISYTTPTSNPIYLYTAFYNNYFTHYEYSTTDDNRGEKTTSKHWNGEKTYKWIILKLNILNNRYIKLRNIKYQLDETNGIPIEIILEQNPDIVNKNDINKIFDSDYSDILGLVLSKSPDYFHIGNLKINGSTNISDLNSWTTVRTIPVSSYDDTKYGARIKYNNKYYIPLNNLITSKVLLILGYNNQSSS